MNARSVGIILCLLALVGCAGAPKPEPVSMDMYVRSNQSYHRALYENVSLVVITPSAVQLVTSDGGSVVIDRDSSTIGVYRSHGDARADHLVTVTVDSLARY